MATATDPKPWTHHRARVAALSRDRAPDDPEVQNARRDMRAERLADYVQRIVSEAPPLTDEQLARITAILRPTLRRTVGGASRAS